MFTQNGMQALRSVVVVLLVFSVFPRWCAADESKVDAEVRTALQTQSTVSVVISLREEPPGEQISDAVKAQFRPDIDAKSAEIRARIRPFTRQNRALPPNVKAEVREMHESLNRQINQMRQEMIRRLKNNVAPSQQRVRTAIENAGGSVYGEVAIVNIMGARLSATAVTQIAALDDVTRIVLEPVQVPGLAGSAPIIYAPRFWDDGYDGGIHDVGIIERDGVEDEHRYLRSKAARKLIERLPTLDEPVGNHGTAVAGVVAMKTDEDANVKHKGIAYGLDKILDGTSRGFFDAIKAMEWAITYPSDGAAVINYSYTLELPGGDKTMDKGDTDYREDYAGCLDRVIDTNGVLIIHIAGNESKKGDKDEYTLGWGAEAYNGIVVGASTASGDNKPRAENEVWSDSSRGPTPLGRKKPDVVAPGAGITTTDRGGGFAKASGTSVAAPHVSGAILLFRDYGLEHPMSQKALLINSAEDRGPDGWDKDWGWGYVDLYTALEQIDYTTNDTIGGGKVKWYKGTMTGCQTATLVWHKHDGQPVANLDMYLYNAKQERLSFSTSVMDNVEQVKMPEGQDGTVYIKIVYDIGDLPDDDGDDDGDYDGDYDGDRKIETFGLALPSNFSSMGPPPPQP